MRLPSYPMQRLAFSALAIAWLLASSLQAQDPDCARYREGQFTIADEDGGPPTIITRKGDRQREEANGTVLSLKGTSMNLERMAHAAIVRSDEALRGEDTGTKYPTEKQRSMTEG